MTEVDTKKNLCDNCKVRNIPECLNDGVVFGDGVGNDNIIICPCFVENEA